MNDERALTEAFDLGVLAPKDDPAEFDLTQPGPFPGGNVPRPGLIVASWTDGNGAHIKDIGKLDVRV